MIQAKHTHPELTSIRNLVESKNDNTPFLLLPVRIETRFMQVEKPVFLVTGKGLESALGAFVDVNFELSNDLAKATTRQKNSSAKKLDEHLKNLNTALNDLELVSNKEKGWLKEQLAVAERNIKTYQKQFGRSTIFTQPLRSPLNRLKTISRKVKTFPSQVASAHQSASQLIKQLHKLNERLQVASTKRLPYTTKKNKKKLYAYLDKLMDDLQLFFDNQKGVRSIKNIDKNQLKRINDLFQGIRRYVSRLPSRLARIHPDGSWASFINQMRVRIKTMLNPVLLQFEKKEIPGLERLSRLERVEAGELFYKGIQLMNEINQFSQKREVKGYSSVKKSRKKLEQKFKKIHQLSNKLVEGDAKQMGNVKELFKKIDTSLNQYNRKLASVNLSNSSQLFGLNKAQSFINVGAKNIISSLTSSSVEQFQFLSSLDLQQSADFQNRMNEAFDEFEEDANRIIRSGRLTDEKKESLLKQLNNIQNQFLISKRKHIVYNFQDYQSLNRKWEQVKQKVIGLDRMEGRGSSQFSTAVGEVQSIISDQEHLVGKPTSPDVDFLPGSLTLGNTTELKNELWVRIYPDDIFVHTHEPGLTENERIAGIDYWTAFWAATNDEDLEMGAWKTLAAAFGTRRAAWIAKSLDPRVNNAARIAFSKKPSIRLVQAIDQLRLAHGLAKKITKSNPLTKNLTLLNRNTFLTRINAAANLLRNTAVEQTYLLQKVADEFRKIHSKLRILHKQVEALDERQRLRLRSTAANAISVLNKFSEGVESFKAIQPISLQVFLQQLTLPFTFPNVTIKADDWTEAPKSFVLPKRFAVITMNGNQFTHIQLAANLPSDPLHLGLDPKKFDQDIYDHDEDNELVVDPDILWMTDFKEAVKVGMGLKIELTEEEAKKGFDKVLVLGIHDATMANSQKLVEQLLENHHYASDGMSLLKIGTPTNNTEGEPAGFTGDNDPEASYATEMEEPLFNAEERNPQNLSDGKRIADALGVKSDTFQHIEHSGGQQISKAMNFNRALWPATFGYFMDEILDTFFTYDNIDRTESFFSDYVVARGFMPSIRIGQQPYGLLTTSAFSKWTTNKNKLPQVSDESLFNPTAATKKKLQTRFDIRLAQLLKELNKQWTSIRKANVKHAHNVGKDDDPQKHFMEMLGLHANSASYYFRHGLNIASRNSGSDGDFSINFHKNEPYSPQKLWSSIFSLLKDGKFITTFKYADELNPPENAFDLFLAQVSRTLDVQTVKSRIYKTRFLRKHSRLGGALVENEPDSIEAALSPFEGSEQNFIQRLLDANPEALFANNDDEQFDDTSLLYLLLRQALLLSYNQAALDILDSEHLYNERYRKQIVARGHYTSIPNSFNADFSTRWSYLFKDMQTMLDKHTDETPRAFYNYMTAGEPKALAEYIFPLSGNTLFNGFSQRNRHRPFINEVKNHRSHVNQLTDLPIVELEQMLREHLDLCSYRLDAWTLGLANKRLMEQRYTSVTNTRTAKKGIHLGAYGWVEDLRPGGAREEAVHVPEGLYKKGGAPIYTDEDNEGLIHMPSINHAIAAAILRSGYTSQQENFEDISNKMAVNLSSARVRKALTLIQGIRNGLEVGAVLGFQFERGLHDRYEQDELDQFILPFRKMFPLAQPVDEDNSANDSDYISNVVNGLKLLDKINETVDDLDFDRSMSLFQLLSENNFNKCPQWLKKLVQIDHGGTNKQLRLILREIDEMADSLDALGDLALSESVYQIVQGNHVRAASVMSALAEGKPIPVPQIMDTPRTGTVVTQRVVLHLEPVSSSGISISSGLSPNVLKTNRKKAVAAGWKDQPFTPRALAEASLNKWLGQVLGDPSNIKCVIEYDTDNASHIDEFGFDELPVQAIDLLYLMSSQQEAGGSQLDSLVGHHFRMSKATPLASDISLNIQYNRRLDTWGLEVKTLFELQPLMSQLRVLLSDAQAVDAEDLQIPKDSTATDDNLAQQDVSELDRRVRDAEASLRDNALLATTALANFEPITSVKINELNDILMQAGMIGIPNATPRYLAKAGETTHGEEVAKQLKIVLKQLNKKINKIDNLRIAFDSSTVSGERIEILMKIVKEIFGNNFLILPHFQLDNRNELVDQMNLSASASIMRHADPLAMNDWIQGVGKVRPKMYAVEMTDLFAENFGTQIFAPQPIQLPFTTQVDANNNDYWLGVEYPSSYQPEEDKLSIIELMPDQLKANGNVRVGIRLDEWIEIIPNKMETSGISFNYDQPDATAPQNILLAVTPEITGQWNWDHLVYTLLDTIALAKNRAVEPDHLEQSKFGQVLPGVLAEIVPPSSGDSESDVRRVVLDFMDVK